MTNIKQILERKKFFVNYFRIIFLGLSLLTHRYPIRIEWGRCTNISPNTR